MLTAQIDLTGFNAGMRGLIHKVGLDSRVVVKKETGELIKALVKVSPPKDPTKTRKSIASDIERRFDVVANESLSSVAGMSGRVGATGILWYRIDADFLRGVAPQNDQRKASVSELEKLRYRITKSGRLNLPFLHPRKHQRVLLAQTILTRKSTVQKLVAKVQKNVGRLKAAWLVATANGGPISITGSNQPPAWVTRHVTGARGRYENGLQIPGKPTFLIANFAKGIHQRAVNFYVQLAVKARAAAMRTNARLILSGKKHLRDYAR